MKDCRTIVNVGAITGVNNDYCTIDDSSCRFTTKPHVAWTSERRTTSVEIEFPRDDERRLVPVGGVSDEAKHVLSKLTSLLDLAIWFNERFRAADKLRLRTSSSDGVRSAVSEVLSLATECLGCVYPQLAMLYHTHDV